MNILLIGNGFDLAHGLFTKYTDFLFFCKIIKKVINITEIKNFIPKTEEDYDKWINKGDNIWKNELDTLNKKLEIWCRFPSQKSYKEPQKMLQFMMQFLKNNSDNQKLLKEILYIVYNNFWIDHFLDNYTYIKENWIDFEKEISKVIQQLDNALYNLSGNYEMDDDNIEVWIKILTPKTSNLFDHSDNKITFKDIRNKLLCSLNEFIRAFEIYLIECVENMDIKIISPDMQNIIRGLSEDSPINILNFNYTDTFRRIYLSENKDNLSIDIDFIHGKADINNTVETNNMVLGIDEYLSEDRKNRDIEFIGFKKFYQRIYKQTGCKYKEWVDTIRKEGKIISKDFDDTTNLYNLYIFGHSLDITDKDILKDLILNDNVYTTIYYLNKDVMGQQITNLVKVIGQDELIKRTGGLTKTIEFKHQQDMEEK